LQQAIVMDKKSGRGIRLTL